MLNLSSLLSCLCDNHTKQFTKDSHNTVICFGLVIWFIELLYNSWLCFTDHYHTQISVPHQSSLHCLVASSASVSNGFCPLWLAPSSCSSRADLTSNCWTNSQHTTNSLCGLGMDRRENTAFQLLHCCMLQNCCLATGMFAEPFPSNNCLYWLHSSCLEQICHNIMFLVHTLYYCL
jgi:hypothetical protein